MARITRDIRALLAQSAEASPMISVHVHTSHRYAIMLTMDSGPYAYIPLFFTMEPNHQYDGGSLPYPAAPPRVLHYSPHRVRIHPNLYRVDGGGKVCLSILGTWQGPGWTAMMTFEQITTMIAALLHDDSLRCEPGYERRDAKFIAEYAHAIKGTMVRTTIQLMRRLLNRGSDPTPYPINLHGGHTLDIAEFRDELAILYLRAREYYTDVLVSHPNGAPVSNPYEAPEHFAAVDAEFAELAAIMSGAALRRLRVSVLTSLPVATVATMCIANHPDRDVTVSTTVTSAAAATDKDDAPSSEGCGAAATAADVTIVVATPDEHKKYPAAHHVPIAGNPQHITENIRSILASEATKILNW